MIELKVEHDYIAGDTADWLADIGEPHAEAQAAFDAFRERDGASYYDGEDIPLWLATLHDDSVYPQTEWNEDGTAEIITGWSGDTKPTGLYHDGAPFAGVTINEDNWLSDDIMVTLAHTAEYGDLLIWQRGYFTSATVNVYAFNGDDDADAYSWSGGAAGHADGSECDSEWIIESACKLWRNGSAGESPRIADLAQDDEGRMLCPDHGVPLAFVGY